MYIKTIAIARLVLVVLFCIHYMYRVTDHDFN